MAQSSFAVRQKSLQIVKYHGMLLLKLTYWETGFQISEVDGWIRSVSGQEE